MKKAVLTGPKQIIIQEADIPKLKSGQVLVKVDYAAICGSDLHQWHAGHPEIAMGHEFSGTIVDAGDSEYKEGDRVIFFCGEPCNECAQCKQGQHHLCDLLWARDYSGLSIDGGFAQYYVGNADKIYKLPDNVSFQQAAMVEPLAVALHGVNQANIKLGDKVLVIGGGIIGQLSGAMARRAGAFYVALSEINAQRMASAKKLGEFDDYFDGADPDVVAKMGQAAGGLFDIVIECTGVGPGLNTALMAIKPGHTVVCIGAPTDAIPVLNILTVLKEIHLVGSIAYSMKEYGVDTVNLISKGGFDPLKYVTDILPLEDIQTGFERLTSGSDPAIKILVKCN